MVIILLILSHFFTLFLDMSFLRMFGVEQARESALILVVLECSCSVFWCHFEYKIVFSYFGSSVRNELWFREGVFASGR